MPVGSRNSAKKVVLDERVTVDHAKVEMPSKGRTVKSFSDGKSSEAR